jgi:hypothetical protein
MMTQEETAVISRVSAVLAEKSRYFLGTWFFNQMLFGNEEFNGEIWFDYYRHPFQALRRKEAAA